MTNNPDVLNTCTSKWTCNFKETPRSSAGLRIRHCMSVVFVQGRGSGLSSRPCPIERRPPLGIEVKARASQMRITSTSSEPRQLSYSLFLGQPASLRGAQSGHSSRSCVYSLLHSRKQPSVPSSCKAQILLKCEHGF